MHTGDGGRSWHAVSCLGAARALAGRAFGPLSAGPVGVRPPAAGRAGLLLGAVQYGSADALPPSAYPSAGRESFWASMEPLAINSSVAQSFCAAYSGDPHLGPRRQPTFEWTFSAFAPEVSPVERVCILKEAPVPRARRCLRVACTPPGHCVAACTRLRPCTTLSASPYKTRSRSSAGSSALLRGAWSSSREAWRPS